jgi:hypothetical protein
MQLCRLVYHSKCNIGSHGDASSAELKHILASAIRNNSKRGITGGLIFNRRFFGQVLEGERVTVMKLFAAIQSDPRHKDIVIVEREPVSERLFGAWSMGYAGNSELFKELCAKFGHAGLFDPSRMSGPDLSAFILALVTHDEDIASSRQVSAA